jgi:pimeloyl-ACP methyl ester carboxylesterase
MNPKSKYVNINELSLHYLEWGIDNKTVICLHALTSNSSHWDHSCKNLTSYYQMVALDQRGHGDSEWAADGYDIELGFSFCKYTNSHKPAVGGDYAH